MTKAFNQNLLRHILYVESKGPGLLLQPVKFSVVICKRCFYI